MIQQVLNWIDISACMESQFNDSYEDLMWLYVKQRTELEDTQEALRRNRNQLESYKCYEKSCINYREIVSKYDKEIAMYENMSVWKFIIKKFK